MNPCKKGNSMEYKRTMVSVVIPVYQAAGHLENCLKSILNQTHKNKEIILIDDGSVDGSAKICDDYAARYREIRCIHQKNKGVSCARNLGINMAQGQYILFVDSDDYVDENYLKDAVMAMQHENIDMYLCGFQAVRKKGNIVERKQYPLLDEGEQLVANIGFDFIKLFQSNVLHAIGTKVYRMDIIEKYGIRFEENWKYYEDVFFCLNYLYHCNRIYIQKKVMYFYQTDIANSLSKHKNNRKYENVHDTYRLLARLIKLDRCDNKKKELFYKLYLDDINTLLRLKLASQKYYNILINRLYKKFSKDSLYLNALRHAGKYEKSEYICIIKKLYWCAYIIHKLQFGIFRKADNELAGKVRGRLDKNRTLFLLMNQWVKIKQRGKNLSAYFEQNGYKEIAIYGMGYVGETLLDELKDSGITVAYCIDQRADWLNADVDIVSLNGHLEKVDVVVVTAITSFDEIEEKLSTRVDCPIVSLEIILYEVLNDLFNL